MLFMKEAINITIAIKAKSLNSKSVFFCIKRFFLVCHYELLNFINFLSLSKIFFLFNFRYESFNIVQEIRSQKVTFENLYFL